MADWIALDDTTKQALRDALGPNGSVSSRSGSAVKAAVASGNDCAVLLPGGSDGTAQLITIQPRPQLTVDIPLHTAPAASQSAPGNGKPRESKQGYEATGFLGLSDEVVFDDEPEPVVEKKSWWKKLVK